MQKLYGIFLTGLILMLSAYAQEKKFEDFIPPASNPVYFESPLSDSKDGLFRERYTFDLIYTF